MEISIRDVSDKQGMIYGESYAGEADLLGLFGI